MRRTLEEQMIERYLSGKMTGSEEQEFFMQIAVDSNLRQRLKAYRIVESAMQKHRDAIPAQHAAARAQLIQTLGATSTPPLLQAARRLRGVRNWIIGGTATSLVVALAVWLTPSLFHSGATPYAPSMGQRDGRTAPAAADHPRQSASSATPAPATSEPSTSEVAEPSSSATAEVVATTPRESSRKHDVVRTPRSNSERIRNEIAQPKVSLQAPIDSTQHNTRTSDGELPWTVNDKPIVLDGKDTTNPVSIKVNVPK